MAEGQEIIATAYPCALRGAQQPRLTYLPLNISTKRTESMTKRIDPKLDHGDPAAGAVHYFNGRPPDHDDTRTFGLHRATRP